MLILSINTLAYTINYISNGPGREQIVGGKLRRQYLTEKFYLKIWRIKNFAEILHLLILLDYGIKIR